MQAGCLVDGYPAKIPLTAPAPTDTRRFTLGLRFVVVVETSPKDRIRQIPIELYDRLVYMSRLPVHESWGGTLEALVIRALEEGSIGIAIAYERFEDKKPITDEVHRQAFGGKPKAKTRMASFVLARTAYVGAAT